MTGVSGITTKPGDRVQLVVHRGLKKFADIGEVKPGTSHYVGGRVTRDHLTAPLIFFSTFISFMNRNCLLYSWSFPGHILAPIEKASLSHPHPSLGSHPPRCLNDGSLGTRVENGAALSMIKTE